MPATVATTDIEDILRDVGPDSTATFDSSPSNPTKSAGSENLRVAPKDDDVEDDDEDEDLDDEDDLDEEDDEEEDDIEDDDETDDDEDEDDEDEEKEADA